jgi:heme oxygenase
MRRRNFPGRMAVADTSAPISTESLPFPPDIGPAPGLAAALREGTAALHAAAERSGVILEIMRGRVTLGGYALYLRNLLPAYTALESGLARCCDLPVMARLRHTALLRAPAIRHDLEALHGPDWASCLPLLGAADDYAAIVAQAAEAGPVLIGHAYARYLGDLSGAQYLRRALVRTAGLPGDAQAFFDFPAIADADGFKAAYRAGLDAAGLLLGDTEAVVEAARTAFRCNIAVSEAVSAALAGELRATD